MKYLRLALPLIIAQFSLVLVPAQAADARKISIEFRGSVGDALQHIAKKGSINLIIVGTLDQPATVYLPNVTAEEALQTVAKMYHLELEKQGSVWTARGGTIAEPRAQDAPVPPAPPSLPQTTAPPPSTPQSEAPPKPPEASEDRLSGKEAKKKISDVTRDLKRKYRKEGDQIRRGDLVVGEGESVREAVVYGGNLTTSSGSTPFVIYRWANEAAAWPMRCSAVSCLSAWLRRLPSPLASSPRSTWLNIAASAWDRRSASSASFWPACRRL